MIDEVYGNAISSIGRHLLKNNGNEFIGKLKIIKREDYENLDDVNSVDTYIIGKLYKLRQSRFLPGDIVLCMKAKEKEDGIGLEIVPFKAED